jgi:hypothetical protein
MALSSLEVFPGGRLDSRKTVSNFAQFDDTESLTNAIFFPIMFVGSRNNGNSFLLCFTLLIDSISSPLEGTKRGFCTDSHQIKKVLNVQYMNQIQIQRELAPTYDYFE